MNNILYLFGSILFFIDGIRVIYTKQYELKDHLIFELGQYSLLIGVLIIMFSFYLLYLYLYRKQIKQKYSICPNCKETFTYEELKNGKCLYCKDVDTIDIEEYYKENKINKDERI
jgi:hypothetical protein